MRVKNSHSLLALAGFVLRALGATDGAVMAIRVADYPALGRILLAGMLIVFSSCFSPYKGSDEGNLVINLGKSSRALLAPGTPEALSHTITVSGGPGGTQTQSDVKLGDSVSFHVAPGSWNISVKAYLGGVLRATADKTQNIQGGRNSVSMPMVPLEAGLYQVRADGSYMTTDYTGIGPNFLGDALGGISEGSGTFVMIVDPEDTTFSGGLLLDPPEGDTLNLTIQGFAPEQALTLDATGAMFYVGPDALLTLDNIILTGDDANDSALVAVDGGELIMKEGSAITGNKHTLESTYYGGGVYVGGNGTFTMEGGTISDNSAVQFGGGVYIASGGTFRKEGPGVIHGRNASEGEKNTAPRGQAVYMATTPPQERNDTVGEGVRLSSDVTPWPEEGFLVGSIQDLRKVGTGTDGWTLSAGYILTAPITLTGDWTPIGNAAEPFTGTFDGGGFTITGLTISNPSSDNQGMFGVISKAPGIVNSGIVKNLTLAGVNISGDNYSYVGGIAGKSSGTIQNSFVAGAISGTNNVGGVAGGNEAGGTINGANFTGGSVTGSGDYAGGVAGYNYGDIKGNSTAVGDIKGALNVGGITGGNGVGTGTIDGASFLSGTVTSDGNYAGGIAGFNHNVIQNADAAGTINGALYVGGIAGSNDGEITDVTASATVSGTGNNVGGIAGNNAAGVREDGVPFIGTISGAEFTGANVTGDGDAVGGVVGYNEGKIQTGSTAAGIIEGVNYVGGVAGINIGGSAVITRTSFTGTSVKAFGNDTDGAKAGGIAGSNEGNIENCYTAGTIIAGDNQNTPTTTTYSGGIAGINSGGILNCYTVADPSANTGAGAPSIYSGGIAGQNSALAAIENCAALCDYGIGIGYNAPTVPYRARITGEDNGTLTNNYGKKGMSGGADDTNSRSINGMDVEPADYNDPAFNFWDVALGWNFETIWEWGTVEAYGGPQTLPVLRGGN